MNDNNKFSYTYSTPTEEEKREVLKIQKAYRPDGKQKNQGEVAKLKMLDKKVKLPAKITAWIMGSVGFVCLGLGMTMVLEWNILIWGSLLGILGILLMSLAYWTHNRIFAVRKKKYADEILALSQNILESDKVSVNIADVGGDEDTAKGDKYVDCDVEINDEN